MQQHISNEVSQSEGIEQVEFDQVFDIDDCDSLDQVKYFLFNPATHKKTDRYVILASPEHELRQKLDADRINRMRERMQFGRNKKLPKVNEQEQYKEDTDYLVSAILGWNLVRSGIVIEFTPQAIRALVTEPKKAWLRKDLLEQLNNTDLFIVNFAKT